MYFLINQEIFLNVQFVGMVLDWLQRLWLQIPRFCYNVFLEVVGNCRMCLIELEKLTKPTASCAALLVSNISLYTYSPFVKKVQEGVMEFELNNHPLDCPICDQGGKCDLQEYSKSFGTDRNRNFQSLRRPVQEDSTEPIIKMTMVRCIQCTRCIRCFNNFTNKYFLGTFGRGVDTVIGSYLDYFYQLEYLNFVINLCPVGALTSNTNSFEDRNWELKSKTSRSALSSSSNKLNYQYKLRSSTSIGASHLMFETSVESLLNKYYSSFLGIWSLLISDKEVNETSKEHMG